MAGILKRFKDIMSANINALLDKAEDPEKMVDQCLRDLEDDLAKVKSETAAVMADERRAKRELDECNNEIVKYQTLAEKAVVAGNDNDAKQFLTRKAELASKQVSLQQAYDLAAANSMKMRQMHDKLVKDIKELNSRRNSIKAKVRVAEAQERINQMTSSIGNAEDSLSAFDRMEAKADNMLDRANAMAELNTSAAVDPLDDLAARYDSAPSAAVEDELAALKAQLGVQQ